VNDLDAKIEIDAQTAGLIPSVEDIETIHIPLPSHLSPLKLK